VKKVVVALAAVAVLAGAGIAAVPLLEEQAADRLKADLESSGDVRIGAVKVDFLTRGITIRDMTVGAHAEIQVESGSATGLAWPLGELLRGRTPLGGLDWGDPLRVGRLQLANVRIADAEGGGTWTIGDLVAEGMDLARYDVDYEGPYRVQAMTARLLGALSVHRIEQSEVAHLSADDAAVSAASVTIEGFDRGLLGKLAIAEFQARAGKARAPVFSVGEVQATGVDLRRLIEMASTLDWEPGAPIGRIPVSQARLSGFGGEMMSRYGLSLGSVTTETVRENAEVSRSRTRVEGFVLSPSLRSVEVLGMRMVMQAMNVNEVRLGLECSGTDDRTKREVTVENCVLSGPNLVEISFTARLTDADEEFWNAVDSGDPFALLGSNAALASAKLVIADKGLLQRGLQAKARFSGQGATAERTALAADVRRYQPHGVLITQDMTNLLDTVARFVEQGGTLTIDAAPQPPVNLDKLDYLLKPGADLVNALGLAATLSR